MSNIGGTKRAEVSDFIKKVGLFEARVITINPNEEEYKEKLGFELKEDSKALEYLGESEEGNAKLRVAVWVEEIKTGDKFCVNFFLEDKEKENKEGTKKQYINNIGICSWADDPNNLPEWFVGRADAPRDYRVARVGEEDLYEFMRTWLGKIDYRKDGSVLELDWKKLMRGNVKELREQIGGEWESNVVLLATIISKEKEDGVKEYQGVYNKAFLPPYALKYFRLVDYSDPEVRLKLAAKKKDVKAHEKFVLKVTGEYGCKDFYILKEITEYDSTMNMAASDKVIDEGNPSY